MDKTDTHATVTGSNSAGQSLEALHSLHNQSETQKVSSYYNSWTSRASDFLRVRKQPLLSTAGKTYLRFCRQLHHSDTLLSYYF